MAKITLTIDGRKVEGELGDTILEVCEKNGIHIPTLCHYKGLSNRGSCRMCVVEIEGARGLMPACTTPAEDGMVIETNNERLYRFRRSNLELILSERNHFCMFCEMSGDCELQDLAYQHGIDYIRYSFAWPKLPVDTSRDYFIFDQNRCILCRRCIRACEELAGHAVLGVKDRGADTMVIADLDTPFGESSCTSCGTCLQVCPTGALVDKKSAYIGKRKDLQETETICTFCSIGCGIKVLSRDGHPVRIEGNWDAEPNGGVLCVAGRFEPLYISKERITSPMMKVGGAKDLSPLQEISWEEAFETIADRIAGSDRKLALISARATVEAASAFKGIFGSDTFALTPPTIERGEGRLRDIDEADYIFVTGADLDEKFRVAGSFVKRSALKGAKLIAIGPIGKTVEERASERIEPEERARLEELLNQASNAVILYGPQSDPNLIELFRRVRGRSRQISLVEGSNARGLEAVGIPSGSAISTDGMVLVLLADEPPTEALGELLSSASFSAVISSYYDPILQEADLILPSPIWCERSGTYINTEGRELKLTAAVEPPEGVMRDEEIAGNIRRRLSRWAR